MAHPPQQFGSQARHQAMQTPGSHPSQGMPSRQQDQDYQSRPQGQQPRSGRQANGTLEQALTPEMEQALQQFFEAEKVCEWCADRCAAEGPAMAECSRLCRDVADLASLNARFIARDSKFGPELVEVFVRLAQECARECARHPNGHCQDCARVLQQAAGTAQQLLQSLQSTDGGGQIQSQQFGGSS